MSILDQVKGMVKQAREDGTLKDVDRYHPKTNPIRWWIYSLIMEGYKPAQAAPRLIGATDEELQDVFKGEQKASTIRWIRWSLEKNGWIMKADLKRRFREGKVELQVFQITDRDLGDSKPPKVPVLEGHQTTFSNDIIETTWEAVDE